MKPNTIKPTSQTITDVSRSTSSGIVEQGKTDFKRSESFTKLKERCECFVDIVDRGCSICFFVGVNAAALMLLLGLLYTQMALENSQTLEQLLKAFGVDKLLMK